MSPRVGCVHVHWSLHMTRGRLLLQVWSFFMPGGDSALPLPQLKCWCATNTHALAHGALSVSRVGDSSRSPPLPASAKWLPVSDVVDSDLTRSSSALVSGRLRLKGETREQLKAQEVCMQPSAFVACATARLLTYFSCRRSSVLD